MGDEARVRELAQQDWGRTRIMRECPDVSEWRIRQIIREVKAEDGVEIDLTPHPARVNHTAVIQSLRPINVVIEPVEQHARINPDELFTAFLWGDAHAPFFDRAAVNVMCQIMRDQADVRLDEVICLGDSIDFYSLSMFEKNPARLNQISEELVVHGELLGLVTEAAPLARKRYRPGNHEQRLESYLWQRAPNLATLPQLQLPSLLGLDSLGWEYEPEFAMLQDCFMVTHGNVVSNESGASARREFQMIGMSGATGHTHRLAKYYHTTWAQEIRGEQPCVWVETGGLFAFPQEWRTGQPKNWQQGFVVVQMASGLVHPTLVEIHQGRAIYNGRLYDGN